MWSKLAGLLPPLVKKELPGPSVRSRGRVYEAEILGGAGESSAGVWRRGTFMLL